ncbi:MAG: Fic family protein [Nanoarchaeota archaeon]
MVYIYKKPIGNKIYYYLRASEKKGKKLITKDIAYLGGTIEEVKSNLDKISEYKEKIRRSYKIINSFLESNHFLEKVKKLKLKRELFLKEKIDEITACKLHYSGVFDNLDDLTKKEILQTYIVEFAYNTASIEGNTINLNEARNLLNEGITPKGKTLREIYDLQNTERVFFDLFNSKIKNELEHKLIIEVHDRLLQNIDERKGYRTTDVRVIRSNFDASPGKYVKTDMNLLLNWFRENKEKIHPLVLAVIFHHKFERIHPFMDGNGRTGRMLMNFILMNDKFSPTIIHKRTRKEYLDALREADECDLWKVNDKYENLINYVVQEFIDTYWSIFL